MIRKALIAGACLALGAVMISAQSKPVPRPPAQAPGQQPPGESATPDGYQPIPQWLGQTHAPSPANRPPNVMLLTDRRAVRCQWNMRFYPICSAKFTGQNRTERRPFRLRND